MLNEDAGPEERQQVLAEVLELGEELFDLALKRPATNQETTGDEPYPVQELREAAHEFFTTLRILLHDKA